MIQSYNSTLLDNAVAELAKLPGIGSKPALRLALHLLRRDVEEVTSLANAITKMRNNINYCKTCHNISEDEECKICSDRRRDKSIVCVVENIKDVIAIESTGEHRGVYHVLGGLISPLDAIGPSDLEIESLVNRIANENISEVILALSPTMEGDTTGFYIFRRLADTGIKISILARGVSVGNDLEYTDELTLGRSIHNRIPFSDTINC